MNRSDVVAAVLAGDYGKPRPALIIQSQPFQELDSVTLLPLTSDLRNWPLFRITVDPDPQNGLHERSQIMVDKAATVSRRKVGRLIGRLDDQTMRQVDRALSRFLGLAA
jgi:mRNA interferase MazF